MTDGPSSHPPRITPQEKKLLDWIRNVLCVETRSITLFARRGVIERAEAEETCSTDCRLHELMREEENQDITIKHQDGKPVSVTRRRKKKL